MNVTLRQIQAFLAVVDLGNFTRAAARMNMAQPALSLTIRELEAELGIRLFDRTTRRVELTAAGADFTYSARKLIDDFELVMRNARELTERKRGRIVIAAPPLLAAMILPGAIADYKSTFPGIDVRLIDTQTDKIVHKVRSGEADCGVGTFNESENGLERQLLVKDALMVFCSRPSPLSKARQVPWRALSEHPVIAMTRDSSIRLLAERAFEAAGQTLRPAFEVSQMTTAVMLVEAGLGVAVLPTYVWSFARDHKVISKPLVEPLVSREISMVHAAGRSLSPAAESFAPFLRRHARLSLPRNRARSASEFISWGNE